MDGTNPSEMDRTIAQTGPTMLETKLIVGTWNKAIRLLNKRSDRPRVRGKKRQVSLRVSFFVCILSFSVFRTASRVNLACLDESTFCLLHLQMVVIDLLVVAFDDQFDIPVGKVVDNGVLSPIGN